MPKIAPIVLALLQILAAGQELRLPLEKPDARWHDAIPVADGATGAAARFTRQSARIEAGPCPATHERSFTLRAALRTNHPGFCTPLMARRGGDVALSLVMGRRPGCVSFEAWSWGRMKLISRSRIDDGRWHRIEVVFEATTNTAYLFVDGELEAAGTLGRGGSPHAVLRLGNNIGAHQPYPGDIDEVEVLPRNVRAGRLPLLRSPLAASARAEALSELRARLFPKASPELEATDAASWPAERLRIRRHVADALGLEPYPERVALAPRVHGRLERHGVILERLSFATWPGYRATGWLWRPAAGTAGRRPAVLCPHGHWQDGVLHPVVQARCLHLAASGYVVLAVDSVHVENVAAGVNSVGAMTWNNIRALDHLVSRDDVDPKRIGVTGASGGAQQTMYLMALEDRIAAAAPICMISYFAEIVSDTSAHCGCNHPPRIAWRNDEISTCAAFAPRPAFFGSVTGDWTLNFPTEGLPEMRRLWSKLGRAEQPAHHNLDAGHNYDRPFREDVYAFFARWLEGEGRRVAERELAPFTRKEMLALGPPPRVPPRAEAMTREYLSRRGSVATLDELAPGLPWRVDRAPLRFGEAAGEDGWRPASVVGGDRVPVPLLVHGNAPAWTLVVPEHGLFGARLDDAWRREGIALVEPRFRGEWQPFRHAWRRNGLIAGRGEAYQAAHDVALAAASLPGDHGVHVVGEGEAGVDALLAAFVCARIEAVTLTARGPLYRERGNRGPQAPELLRFADLDGLTDLLRARGCRVIVR